MSEWRLGIGIGVAAALLLLAWRTLDELGREVLESWP